MNLADLTIERVQKLLRYATDEERSLIAKVIAADKRVVPWRPLPGPQTLAYNSVADVIGFGGAAGGGKTDLAVGKTLTQHRKIQIFRRVGTELTSLEDRFIEIVGHDKGYNSTKKIWRNIMPGVQLEMGSVPNAGDEEGYRGRPKDLLVIDEASTFLFSQVQFLMGWVRTTIQGQRTQTLMTFNPPTDAEGRWVIEYFAPWLDDKYAGTRAQPGELRYFVTMDGVSVEVPDGTPFHYTDKEGRRELLTPQSRTFIPSRVTDNPFLVGTNYMTQLQALPEPLRSQMLYGDFAAGMEDSEWQVIPTRWVDEAMARWKDKQPKPEMLGLGVDVARGGADRTIIARRHIDNWFDKPLVYPGKDTPDGPTVAGLVIAATRNRAVQHVDVIGIGASPYDFLVEAKQQVMGVNVSEKSYALDRSGRLGFMNLRSQLWWQFRELLDPDNNLAPALPPDRQLRADLCAPIWKVQSAKIYVESRDDIIKRIGRSPDWASAYILAAIDTPRHHDMPGPSNGAHREYDPYANLQGVQRVAPRDHDPYR